MQMNLLKSFLFSTILLAGSTAYGTITDNGSPAVDPLTLSGGDTAGTVVATVSSEVNLSGGTASNVTMNDTSTFNAISGIVSFQTTLNNSSQGIITGGTFTNVAANDSADLTFGGTAAVNSDLAAQGSSIVNVTGGTLGPFTFANESSNSNFLGGNFGEIFYENNSVGTISGGAIWDTLNVQTTGVISIIGSGFALDGLPVSGNLTSGSGNLVGLLQNGDTLNVSLGINSGTVALIPEPTTTSLALLYALLS